MGDAVDLAITGGALFDSLTGTFASGDVLVSAGRIVAQGPDVAARTAARRTIDAARAIVSPGLVDMHTHVFAGQDLGVRANLVGPRSGTTTFVDTGSAGAHLWGAFHSAIAQVPQRVVALINIASIGTTSILLQGELKAGGYTNVAACVEAAISGPRPYGVKVRASADVAGERADSALAAARTAATELGCPLMVHLGPAPSTVDMILSQLQRGDILTHCFTTFSENGLIADGMLRPTVRAARERGVLFDVGHGMSGFDSVTAAAAIELGFVPDTISTDLHAYSMGHVVDLPTVLTRFLALGLPLAETLTRATSAPARILGLLDKGVGHLAVGGVADIAILRLVDEPVAFVDANHRPFAGGQRLVLEQTIQGGVVLYDAQVDHGEK